MTAFIPSTHGSGLQDWDCMRHRLGLLSVAMFNSLVCKETLTGAIATIRCLSGILNPRQDRFACSTGMASLTCTALLWQCWSVDFIDSQVVGSVHVNQM